MRGTWPVEQPTLTDGAVLLRPWRPEDAEEVFRACQDADLQHFTQVPVLYLLEHAVGFVADAPRQWAEGTGAQFAVTDPTTGQLLGCMGLLEADRGRGRIGAGYWTAPWARSRGLTRRALRLATGWALGDGGFDVVVLEVELDNPRSMAVVRSVGYVPGDAPIDSWELKGSMRHFVALRITRSELEARAGEAGAQPAAPATAHTMWSRNCAPWSPWGTADPQGPPAALRGRPRRRLLGSRRVGEGLRPGVVPR